MYNIAFDKEAEKEFLRLDADARNLVAAKILDLQEGRFHNDKPLKGKHRGKFRKRAGNYRIIYLREGNYLLITIIRIAHRREAY